MKILSLVLIPVFLASSFFAYVMYRLTKRKKEEMNKDRVYFVKKRYLQNMLKQSWFNRLDKYLKDGDYPYAITSEIYILLHLATFIVAVFLWIKTGNTLSIKIMILAPIYINLLIHYKRKHRRNQFQLELCNIQDIVYFQSKIGTPDDVIFAYAAKESKEPLKMPLSNFADKFRLNKNLNKALEEFRKASNSMEFQAFTFIIEQKQKTGYSEENHHAQATMLKRSKRMRRKINREAKRVKLIVAAFLMFSCYMAFASVPLLMSVARKIDLLLK